jgi:hypothetical protein
MAACAFALACYAPQRLGSLDEVTDEDAAGLTGNAAVEIKVGAEVERDEVGGVALVFSTSPAILSLPPSIRRG